MIYIRGSVYEGEADCLYRTPQQIKEDIINIKRRIEATSGMLNIRSIITEMLSEYDPRAPGKWISALEEVVQDARDTLNSLKSLNSDLDLLRRELEDVRWAMRM